MSCIVKWRYRSRSLHWTRRASWSCATEVKNCTWQRCVSHGGAIEANDYAHSELRRYRSRTLHWKRGALGPFNQRNGKSFDERPNSPIVECTENPTNCASNGQHDRPSSTIYNHCLRPLSMAPTNIITTAASVAVSVIITIITACGFKEPLLGNPVDCRRLKLLRF